MRYRTPDKDPPDSTADDKYHAQEVRDAFVDFCHAVQAARAAGLTVTLGPDLLGLTEDYDPKCRKGGFWNKVIHRELPVERKL
jgi:hypothetical protein